MDPCGVPLSIASHAPFSFTPAFKEKKKAGFFRPDSEEEKVQNME